MFAGLILGLPALMLGPAGPAHAWVLRAGHWPSVITGAWVHLDRAHLMLNMAALAVLVLLGWHQRLHRVWALAWLLAWPLGHVALLSGPLAPAWMAGASGVLHAAAAVLSIALWVQCRQGWPAGLLFLGLVIKLGMESAWSMPVQGSAFQGFPVVVASHLTGALSGWGLGLLAASGFHSLRLSGR